MSYSVSLASFDGPLDLLLTLIGKAQIDICDIFVSEITEQYLSYMDGVDELDMDSASEFIQMAATLLEIKSRRLLPALPKPEDPEEETPEQQLIRQLIEYKAFKEVSGEMKKLEGDAALLLTKLPEEYPLPPRQYELTGLTLEGLQRAFARVLLRLEQREGNEKLAQREIKRDTYTVGQCMTRIQSRIRKAPITFDSLFRDVPERDEMITLFLALLELLKLNKIEVEQRGLFGEITISAAKQITE